MDTLRVIPGLDLDMTDKLLALKTEKLTVPPEAVLSCLKDLHEEVGLEEDDVDDLCKLFSDACKELLSLHWLHKKSIAACDEAVGRMSTTGVGEEPLQKINASIDISEKVSPTEANTAILCIAAETGAAIKQVEASKELESAAVRLSPPSTPLDLIGLSHKQGSNEKATGSSGEVADIIFAAQYLLEHSEFQKIFLPLMPEALQNTASCKWLTSDPQAREYLEMRFKEELDDFSLYKSIMEDTDLPSQAKEFLEKESVNLEKVIMLLRQPSTIHYIKYPTEDHWANLHPELKRVIAAFDAVAPSIVDYLMLDEMKPAFAGINFSGMLTKMMGPSVIQYLQNPTDEGWLKLDPALTEVIKKLDELLLAFANEHDCPKGPLCPFKLCNFSTFGGFLTKLVSPAALIFLKYPTDEAWHHLTPDLKTIAMKLATGFAKGACLSRPAFAATEVDVMLAFVKAAFIDPARTLWNPKTWVFIVTMAEDAWQALDLDTQRVLTTAAFLHKISDNMDDVATDLKQATTLLEEVLKAAQQLGH